MVESRRTLGIGGVQTPTSRVFCTEFQVQPELHFQVAVVSPWKQGPPETVNPFAKDAHAISGPHASPCSNEWMMPAIRFHACLSLTSSRRPAGVTA